MTFVHLHARDYVMLSSVTDHKKCAHGCKVKKPDELTGKPLPRNRTGHTNDTYSGEPAGPAGPADGSEGDVRSWRGNSRGSSYPKEVVSFVSFVSFVRVFFSCAGHPPPFLNVLTLCVTHMTWIFHWRAAIISGGSVSA